MIKLDKKGNKVWDKTYRGSDKDGVWSLIQTTDGGYAVAGYTQLKGAGEYDGNSGVKSLFLTNNLINCQE